VFASIAVLLVVGLQSLLTEETAPLPTFGHEPPSQSMVTPEPASSGGAGDRTPGSEGTEAPVRERGAEAPDEIETEVVADDEIEDPSPVEHTDLTRSAVSHEETNVTIVNTCTEPVELVWLHMDGSERGYGQLRGGALRNQPTYVGHVWVVRLAGDEPRELARFAATADEEVYTETCPEGDPLYTEPEPTRGAQQDLCSTASDHRLRLQVHNRCERRLEMFWVDFDCSLSTRDWVEPGQTFLQSTYAGHVWQAVDADGNRHAHFVADATRTEVTVTCDD
jgi:hypothetical protein